MYLPTPMYKLMPYLYIGAAVIGGVIDHSTPISKISFMSSVILIIMSAIILSMRHSNAKRFQGWEKIKQKHQARQKLDTSMWESPVYRR